MSAINQLNNTYSYAPAYDKITIGEVVDTNDPQQMGRIRILCPYLGDSEDALLEDIPWATQMTPFAGSLDAMDRGRSTDDVTTGPVSYGMFNVPKVGAFAVVMCLEGDPKFRLYLGCVHGQFLPHTMPHGRRMMEDGGSVSKPLSSTESPIEPLSNFQEISFSKTESQKIATSTIESPYDSYEYVTRCSDYCVAGIDPKFIRNPDVVFSNVPDDKNTKYTNKDGKEVESLNGYKVSRVYPNSVSSATGKVYDPQIYSWTTPGFHSLSMDDSDDNCRIRFRTTHGHQIIMDDTNERIYINTSQGKTWLEFDEKGNIDIYGERNISLHAEGDINLTAGNTIRMKSKNSTHLVSEGEIRLHSITGTMYIKTGNNLQLDTIGDINIKGNNFNITSTNVVNISAVNSSLNLYAGGDTNLLSESDVKIKSNSTVNIFATGDIMQTGAIIHLNGNPALEAIQAGQVDPNLMFEAWWTNRIPEHEPWPRVMTKSQSTDVNFNNTHVNANEYQYNDDSVGRVERGVDLNRNPKWKR